MIVEIAYRLIVPRDGGPKPYCPCR